MSTPIGETWRELPWVLVILILEGINFEKAEKWFEPVLNEHTSLPP
jgi:hypothetical protein